MMNWGGIVFGRKNMYTILRHPLRIVEGQRSRVLLQKGGKELIIKLLMIAHLQWTSRNTKKHYKKKDGKTEEQRRQIFRQVQKLVWTDPT